uniref:Uncharacterized protein n=1 Tax=Megaselia scalaris TaxID=36166 RepID=T1GQ68_MEGSC
MIADELARKGSATPGDKSLNMLAMNKEAKLVLMLVTTNVILQGNKKFSRVSPGVLVDTLAVYPVVQQKYFPGFGLGSRTLENHPFHKSDDHEQNLS